VNVEWSVTKPGIWPFTATMALQTADYANYDLQNWPLSVVLESTYSKSAKREGEIKFLLEIKDVCWDLPLSAFALKSATQIYDIWIPHQIAHDYLLDVWSDYCTGSSYSLMYVSGPKLPTGADPLVLNINQYYTDVTKYNTPGLAVDPYLQGTIPDLTWEGDHTVRIVAQQGTTKLYRKIDGPSFVIRYRNPCKGSIVTPRVINSINFTVGSALPIKTVYQEFKDSVSTLLGDGYNKCDDRVHYLSKPDGSGRSEANNTQLYSFLSLVSDSAAYPMNYIMQVQTFDYSLIGRHDFLLNVALKSYPGATIASVPFSVMIAPCIVQSLVPPPTYDWKYQLGAKGASYFYSF